MKRQTEAAIARATKKERSAEAVNWWLVKALLRKQRQESGSSFRQGNFDAFGFLLRLLLIGSIVALFVVFFGRFAEIYTAVKVNGVTDVAARENELLSMFYTALVAGMTIGGIGQLGRELFAADDVKLFSAMPVNAKTLFLAKLITIYGGQFFIALVAVFTVNLTFAINVGITFGFILLSLLMCFLVPLVSIAIAALLLVPYQLLKEFLRERFLALFLLVTVLLGLAFWGYSLVLSGVKTLLLGDSIRYFFNEKIMTAIGKAVSFLYPARWFANIVTGRSLLVSWLGLLLVLAVCLVASMLIIRFILGRALQARNEGRSHAMLKSKQVHKRRPQFVALLKKEFLLIFRTPAYVFSYFSVAVVMPLMVYFCMDVGVSLVESLVGLECNLELAIFLTILFGSLTNVFCATNVSRDGEMFYTVKAMPIGYKTVFFSKVVLCLLVTALSQVASAVLLLATGSLGFGQALFLILIGMLFSFFNVAVATRYDFNHARFSTEEDGEIKESSGTVSAVIVMGMLLSFAVGALIFAVQLVAQLKGIEAAYLTYLLSAGIALLAAGLSTFYLVFRLDRKYYEFSGGGI